MGGTTATPYGSPFAALGETSSCCATREAVKRNTVAAAANFRICIICLRGVGGIIAMGRHAIQENKSPYLSVRQSDLALMVDSFLNSSSDLANQGTIPQR